ncbi:MAG: DUF455 family protein [Candidatus Eisenbacteria bacterium]
MDGTGSRRKNETSESDIRTGASSGSEVHTGPVFDSVRSFCLHILESGDLESKLVPPRGPGGDPLLDVPGPPVFLDRPARQDHIQIRSGADRLPNLNELKDRHARSACVERFANHELMAVELFAWALVAYPEMPSALRRGLLHVLEEEQGHVRLYLDRLAGLGSGLGQSALSDYFWQQVPGIKESPNGPASFLCVMGLTFEQANLDFSLLYRDAFRQNGDEESARALDIVHKDEIGHVRLAARWLEKVARPDGDGHGHVPDGHDPDAQDLGENEGADALTELYDRFVPFPLSAARAKGRRFEVAARRRAGLSDAFIEHVRLAKPYGTRDRGGTSGSSTPSTPSTPAGS